MIDETARRRLAEAARALVVGRITNDEFEARVPESNDPAVMELYSKGFWLLYGDLSEHKLVGKRRLDPAAREFAARCIIFLKSGQEYSWPVEKGCVSLLKLALGVLSLGIIPWLLRDEEAQPEFWPFKSKAALQDALENPRYFRAGV